MALLSKFHIANSNALEHFTLGSVPTVEATYPLANLTDQIKGKPARWDFASADLLQITGTNATARPINGLMIKGHNLLSDADVRIRYWDAASQAGNKLLDTATLVYGALPGTTTNFFSTPDAAANSITGDIDIRIRVALADWTPAANTYLVCKHVGTGNQRSFLFYINTSGRPVLIIYPAGSGTPNFSYTATASPAVDDGDYLWLRMTLDVDNGASNSVAQFSTSADYDPDDDTGTWTPLGSNVLNSSGVSIFDGTAPIEIGTINNGASGGLNGSVSRAQIFNGIDGTLAVDFDPAYWKSGGTFVAPTGETWTLNGTASIEFVGQAIYTVIPGDATLTALDPYGNFFDSAHNVDTVFSHTFDKIDPKSFQIDINVPSPVSDIVEIDKLAMFYAWAPDKGPERGASFVFDDDSEHRKTRAGGVNTTNQPARRTASFRLPIEGNDDTARLLHMLETAKKSGDLYILADPNADGYSKYQASSIFRRVNNAGRELVFFDGNEIDVQLVEN